MATCNDCLHYDVCSLWSPDDLMKEESHKYCLGNFKDKSQFVEVVRCEECRFASLTRSGAYGCSRRVKYEEMPPTHFCGYGERKITNETDN